MGGERDRTNNAIDGGGGDGEGGGVGGGGGGLGTIEEEGSVHGLDAIQLVPCQANSAGLTVTTCLNNETMKFGFKSTIPCLSRSPRSWREQSG